MYFLLKELTWSRQIPNRPVCLRKGNNPLCARRKPFMMRIVSLRTGVRSGWDFFFPHEKFERKPASTESCCLDDMSIPKGAFWQHIPFLFVTCFAQWHVFSPDPKWTKDQANVDALHTDWLHHVSSAQSVAGIDPCRPLPFKGACYVFVLLLLCVCVCVCMRVTVVPLVKQRITFFLPFSCWGLF